MNNKAKQKKNESHNYVFISVHSELELKIDYFNLFSTYE